MKGDIHVIDPVLFAKEWCRINNGNTDEDHWELEQTLRGLLERLEQAEKENISIFERLGKELLLLEEAKKAR